MLYNETTLYILAGILLFIVGLIIFCCCRIWYDLLGCKERGGGSINGRRGGDGLRGGGKRRWRGTGTGRGGGRADEDRDLEAEEKVDYDQAGEYIFGPPPPSKNKKRSKKSSASPLAPPPIMRVIVTDADKVEEQLIREGKTAMVAVREEHSNNEKDEASPIKQNGGGTSEHEDTKDAE